MTYTVSVSVRAKRDFNRLIVWLFERDARAAARLGPLLESAIDSLTEAPSRGRPVGPTTREISIPFGQSAYVMRYRLSGSNVYVTRIWHSLEQR
ncbi:type II toxin-antitoxin system RelE/ParE family toxin [Caulobacter sp. SL161]|nr:type II toxin-antitoxin system RelE/ParE family toxin [Caulobacter sp. SL161]MCY1646825.1 type II toxin-antitoxin system RelE/ParE family toxin [Caulobacter sp. SL161]